MKKEQLLNTASLRLAELDAIIHSVDLKSSRRMTNWEASTAIAYISTLRQCIKALRDEQ